MNATGANTRSAINSGWPSVALGYRYHVQLGKMLDEKRVTGNHLRPYLRNTDVQWDSVNVHDLPMMDFDAADRERYLLQKGDLLVCEGGEIGRAAIWSGELSECYYQKALHRLRPLDLASEHPRFMYYALLAAVGSDAYVNGGKSTIAHLPADQFRRIRLPRPPYREQERIASFLDQKTARIDALIAEKELLAQRLTEGEASRILSLVVGQTHDSTSDVAPGSVDRSKLPKGWKFPQLARLVSKLTNGYVGPTRDILVPEGVRYLQSLHIKGGSIDFGRGEYYVPDEWSQEHAKSILAAGDVLIVQTGDIGQTALVSEEFSGCNCHALIIATPVPEVILPEYLELVLRSPYGRACFSLYSTGALHPHLNCSNIRELRVPLPSLHVQRQIVTAALEVQRHYRALRAHVEKHVAALLEYRAALISGAVTGNLGHPGCAETASEAR